VVARVARPAGLRESGRLEEEIRRLSEANAELRWA
jgi:hypothetical protein